MSAMSRIMPRQTDRMIRKHMPKRVRMAGAALALEA
jgi:hypothetical protein